MPETFFISDTHFGHANIIRHCSRPFGSVGEMDTALAANWNATVGPADEVWHLGDFAYKSRGGATAYLDRLHGRKHLVWGNHDDEAARAAPGWASSQAYAEIALDGVRLVLFHYAMKTWRWAGRGGLHLYGHSHGRLPGDSRCCDVGVDARAFRPLRLAEIRQRLAASPAWVPVDHHGAE